MTPFCVHSSFLQCKRFSIPKINSFAIVCKKVYVLCAMCTLFWACLSCSALTDLIATHSIVIRSGNSIVKSTFLLKTVERLPHIPTIQNPLQKHINIDFVLESVVELFERKKEKKNIVQEKSLLKKGCCRKKSKTFFLSKICIHFHTMHLLNIDWHLANRFQLIHRLVCEEIWLFNGHKCHILNVLTVNFDLKCCICLWWYAIIRFTNVDTVMNSIHVRHIYCVITYWRRCINR